MHIDSRKLGPLGGASARGGHHASQVLEHDVDFEAATAGLGSFVDDLTTHAAVDPRIGTEIAHVGIADPQGQRIEVQRDPHPPAAAALAGDFDRPEVALSLHQSASQGEPTVTAKAGVDEPAAHLSQFQGSLAVGVDRAKFEAAVLEVDHGGKLGGFEENSNGNLERDEWAQQLAGGLIPECGGSILGDRRFARPAEDGSNPEHGSVDLQLPQAQLAGQHRQQIDRPQYARDLQPRASLVWPGANSSGVQLNPIFPRNR